MLTKREGNSPNQSMAQNVMDIFSLTKAPTNSGGAAIMDNQTGNLAMGHADIEGIEELLWNRPGEWGIKFQKHEELVGKLDAFCQEIKNAHKKVKDWTLKIKTSMKDLAEDIKQLQEEWITNNKEMKRLRCLLLGQAEISLQIMESSIAQAPAGSSSPINQKRAVKGPNKSGLQPISKKLPRNTRRRLRLRRNEDFHKAGSRESLYQSPIVIKLAMPK